MVTPGLFLAVYFGTPMLNSQTRHMRAVDAHIEKITPQWEKFRAEHPGFDSVKLFAYTDGTGCLEHADTLSVTRRFPNFASSWRARCHRELFM